MPHFTKSRRVPHYLFIEALDAVESWHPEQQPEPTVEEECEVYTLSELCGQFWNCSDILPASQRGLLERLGCQRHTYAAAARGLKAYLDS